MSFLRPVQKYSHADPICRTVPLKGLWRKLDIFLQKCNVLLSKHDCCLQIATCSLSYICFSSRS